MSFEPGVLLLTPCFSPNTGGIETHLDDLVKYLHSKKRPVTVITYRPLADDIKDYKKLEKLGEVTIQRRWWPRNKAVAKYTTNPYLTASIQQVVFCFMRLPSCRAVSNAFQ